MSEILSSIQSAYSKALDAARTLSADLPGSRTTQALVVGAAVGTAVYLLLKKRYRLPPGPFALPILGNLLDVVDKKEPLYMKLKRWAEEKYGPVILIYFGPLRCVTLNRLDVVTEAYIERGTDFAGRPQFHSMSVFSEGYKDILFAITPSVAWKLHRKIATKALRHYMRGQHLEKVIHHVVSMVTDRMLAEAEAFEPKRYMSFLMFHIIETICFGKMKDYNDPAIVQLIRLFDAINVELGNGFWEDIIPPLRYFPTKKFQKFEERMQEFMNYIYTRIDEHKKTFSENNIRDITDSVLLAQKEAEREESSEVIAMFTDTHVGQTVSDIFGGGIDTSRQTLDWCIYYMAGHPKEQALVHAEINKATGSRLPGEADRPNLVYTEATLYEIMRIAPAVPMGLPHEALSDTTVGGYNVPKGTLIFVNQWALLRDPEQWESPEEFNPKRFIDQAGKLKSKLPSWLPFSTGRRACLGEFVAKPELLMIFACILKRCKISLPPGVAFDPTPQISTFLSNVPRPYQIVATKR